MPVDILPFVQPKTPKPALPNGEAFDFDFTHNVILFPGNEVEHALMEPTHAGGVDEMNRFQAAGHAIGHFIRMAREGRCSVDEAWKAVIDWNSTNLVPPWEESRLQTDFKRLLDQDVREKGPLALPSPFAAPAPTDWQIGDWQVDRFLGEAPERVWLVEGIAPQGTAGVFASAGDSGKSMLALRLALMVTTSPPRNPDLNAGPKFFGGEVMTRGAAVVL